MHQLSQSTFEHRSRVQDFLLHEVQLAVVAVAQSHQITLQMQGGVLIVRLIRQPPCANNRTITTDTSINVCIVTLGSVYGVFICGVIRTMNFTTTTITPTTNISNTTTTTATLYNHLYYQQC